MSWIQVCLCKKSQALCRSYIDLCRPVALMYAAKRRRLVDAEPKRALTGYAYYELHQRTQLSKSGKSSLELGRIIEAQWRALSKSGREPWEQYGAEETARYAREVADLRAQAGAGMFLHPAQRTERGRLGEQLQPQSMSTNNFALRGERSAELGTASSRPSSVFPDAGRELSRDRFADIINGARAEYSSRVAAGRVHYSDQRVMLDAAGRLPAGPPSNAPGWYPDRHVALPPNSSYAVQACPRVSKKRGRKKKQGGEPKRSLSAYTYYVMDTRGTTASSMPGASFKVVATEVGQRWKALTEEERAPYAVKAKLDTVKGNAARAAWKASIDAKHSAEVALDACRPAHLRFVEAVPARAAPVLKRLHSGWGVHSAVHLSASAPFAAPANSRPPPLVMMTQSHGAGGPVRSGHLLHHALPRGYDYMRSMPCDQPSLWDAYGAASVAASHRAYAAQLQSQSGSNWAPQRGNNLASFGLPVAPQEPLGPPWGAMVGGSPHYAQAGGRVGPAPGPGSGEAFAHYAMSGRRGAVEGTPSLVLPPRQPYDAAGGSMAAPEF